MDRLVNVRLFSVEAKEAGALPFSEALQHIHGMPLANREHELEPDLVIRLEELTPARGLLSGEIIRLQSANLPPKALRGHRRERLGVRSIGHTTAFVFDTKLSVLAIQLARNGITTARLGLYAEALAGGSGYDILPVPNAEIWNVLRRGGVRGVSFRVSSPNELQAIDEETRGVRRGLMAMKESLQPSRVEVTLSMSRRAVDMDRKKTVALFGWLQRERQERRGHVSRMVARVVPNDGEDAEILNLIGGHMGDKDRLNLPDDDPDCSYAARNDYIHRVLRANRLALEEMYG